MAIPEACGVWIEQRVQEELEQRGESGDSLREISRRIATEVEKYFETKVNPGTILTKAARMSKGVSNETVAETLTAPSDSAKIKQIKRPAKDGTMRGGPRPGAGRKMKTSDANTSFEDLLITSNNSLDDILITPNYLDEGEDLFAIEPVAKGHEGMQEESEQGQSAEKKTDSSKISHAMQFAIMAISQLERIRKNDPNKEMAFNEVKEYMEQNR